MLSLFVLGTVFTLLAQAPAFALRASAGLAQPVPATVPARYVPERVFDTGRNTFSDFELMLADLARADVILVGEQHDDPNTHRLEAALLQGLLRRRGVVTVSLEMFERDVQGSLDAYLAGRVTEEEFLKASRPWPRYATDYREIVELARTHGSLVIASNVPRRLASAVSKGGESALAGVKSSEPTLTAREMRCPLDAYYERFSAEMSKHPAPDAEKDSDEKRSATTHRYYLSQCLKDETMAESIVSAFERPSTRLAPPGSLRTGHPISRTIVHYNGAFHSDFGAGVAERVRRRLPARRVAVVTILPVTDLDAIAPAGEDLKRAEYLVYTLKSIANGRLPTAK